MWPFRKENKGVPVAVSNRNVLFIQAFAKQRTVTVSYKGQVKTGKFEDNVIRNMLHGKNFKKNTQQFCGAIAKLLEQLTQ